MIRLENAGLDGNPCGGVKCKACRMAWEISWDTEYGDPIIGEHEVTCPHCDATISFSVYNTYTTL